MKHLIICLVVLVSGWSYSQTGNISGTIMFDGEAAPQITIKLKGTGIGTVSDFDGNWSISDVPFGTYTLIVSNPKYDYYEAVINLTESNPYVEIELQANPLLVDQIVVTATRTDKRKTDAPVIVGVINSKTLENVQACTLSDGLKFQPGLRVETDCQTCNYTQLRMNGLAGGYSQILINGRPIFSPLTGLYGLEQIPTNMIDRIEVVRGGGSALFGSSAIGGTVNVVTKLPKRNNYAVSNNTQFLGNGSVDNILSGNATLVSENKNSGISFFVNNRNRNAYDHNGDNYSEMTELRNLSFGTNMFFLPTEDQKIELSFSRLNEYRFGGEMTDGPAHFAQQAEERVHDVYIGSLDYQINFNENKSSLIIYTAGQFTSRSHYTGVVPDDSTEFIEFVQNPPYGTSQVSTMQIGSQFNHKVKKFPLGENVFTLGAEYIYDDVLDEIPAYNYIIDQTTRNAGVFAQSDWKFKENFKVLLGARADQHNFLDAPVISPRTSLMYTVKDALQFRVGWAKGFRAPQAFDSDMHIAFAGGGISRITLSEDLIEERSNSYTASFNYDKRGKHYVAGFTIEGFYTELGNAFYYHPLGEDAFGELFEKRNGEGATVMGASIELRLNWKNELEFESGFTLQESTFDTPILYSDALERTDVFLRTPNTYGYANLYLWPKRPFRASISSVYTGPMTILHLAGAPEQTEDAFVTSSAFFELNTKLSYDFKLSRVKADLQVFGGVKNILNSFQNDFDTGKNRDSNFVYGPAQPRTIFIGIKLSSI